MNISDSILNALSDERIYQDRKWGTIMEHPHEVGSLADYYAKVIT